MNPRSRFYSGLDDKTAAYWLAQTEPHSASAQLAPLTYVAYMHHLMSYIISTEDQALPPAAQRDMVEACRGQRLEVDVHEVAADHSPYLSRDAEVIAILG